MELAQAELWALTGCEASGRLGVASVGCDVSRSAYVAACVELVAQAQCFEDLREGVRDAKVEGREFRIDVRKLAPKVEEGSPDIARGLADVMAGFPNLDAPRQRYLVVCQEGSWHFGRVVSGTNRGDRGQASRPWNFSQALMARHARALVNLVAAPGETLIDPCCGVGTCVIEAGQMGIRVMGSDTGKGVLFNAAANLAALGHPGSLAVADARCIGGAFDAAVIDFPYGHTSRVQDGLYEEILNNIAPRVLRLGVVTGRAMDALFAGLSLEIRRCARVRARQLVRHFYVLGGLRQPAPASRV